MAFRHRGRSTRGAILKSVSIITGFLGSGKTTLLNRLLRHPDMATTAVLINELGDIGVDNLVIEHLDEDVVLLESGCVCCSVRDDLTASLLRLHARAESGDIPDFEQVVLETTGIADPASIVQLLMSDRLVCERYRLGTITTVVDACFAPSNLEAVPEATRQVLLADYLVISKSDLVETSVVDALCSKISDLNPVARRLLAPRAEPTILFQPDPYRERGLPLEELSHAHRYSTFQLAWAEPVDWDSVEAWIEGLLSARGDDLWRIKGLLNIRGEARPLVFQSVQHSVYVPETLDDWPDGRRRTELTFIARHFSREAAIQSVRPFFDARIDE